MDVDVNEVTSIYFRYSSGQGRPEIIDDEYKKSHFELQTSLNQEIKYIVHYLNSFSLTDDGKNYGGGDIPIVNISLIKKDGVDKIGFISGRFYDSGDKQYDVNPNEYSRFLDFIYALKTEKINLSDEVTSIASEWAKTDIEKAKENG